VTTGDTLMCISCGYLVVPAERTWAAGDPLRTEGGGDRRDTACPSCGARQWADLGEPATITALRHVDAVEAPTRVSAGTRALRRLWAVTRGVSGIAIGAALIVGLVTSTIARGGLLVVLYPMLVGLVIVVVATVVDAVREVRDVRPAELPARWHLALPDGRAPAVAISGIARATGPLLRAPLTGRPCIAYELGVRTDADGGAPESTWLLLEQRSTAFTVDETRYPPDAVRLDLVRIPIDPEAFDERRIQHAMRSRGFLASDVTLALFEAIVPDEAAIDVRPVASTSPARTGTRELPRVRLSPVLPVHAAAVGDRA